MNVLTVVGARPQFIKAFAVSRELRPAHEEVLVHTGQHYDEELSDVFFNELEMSQPEYNLEVGSDTHGRQTGQMLQELESVIEGEDPDVVLLYGDTNSTLAGAIAASKMDPLVAHVEAGLRSYNRDMPEEINRVLTDHASDVLFAPSESAVETLREEGITEGVHFVGDVMYDALLWARSIARQQSTIIKKLQLVDTEYILATVHRAKNTDCRERLESIFNGLSNTSLPVVLPVHPRTKKQLQEYNLWEKANNELTIVDPVGYLDFIRLMDNATRIATDSGGVQKEAFFLETPCVTMRNETEWIETVDYGWNVLVGANEEEIVRELNADRKPHSNVSPYGDGTAAVKIVDIITSLD